MNHSHEIKMPVDTNQMSPPDSNGIRPGFLLTLAATVVALIALLWLVRSRPSSPKAAGEERVAEPPAQAAKANPATAPAGPVKSSALEEMWGIEVTGIGLTRTNSAIELRYKVLAPEKATLLADSQSDAYILDHASGAKIPLRSPQPEGAFPQHSRARSAALMMRESGSFPPTPSRIVPDKVYSVLLPNPGGVVKGGNKVAIVVGAVRNDNLVVEHGP
jgi:hypothetical protein